MDRGKTIPGETASKHTWLYVKSLFETGKAGAIIMILKVHRCLQLQLFGVQSSELEPGTACSEQGTVLPCAGVRCLVSCVHVPARRDFLPGVLMGWAASPRYFFCKSEICPAKQHFYCYRLKAVFIYLFFWRQFLVLMDLFDPTVLPKSKNVQEIHADQETIGKISAADQRKFVFITQVFYFLNSFFFVSLVFVFFFFWGPISS